MKKLLMFLQLFAEEGAAAAPADRGAGAPAADISPAPFSVGDTLGDGTQVENAKVAAALNRQMKRHPELRQVYAQGQRTQQPQAVQPVQPAEPQQMPEPSAEGQPTADDRQARWNEIKKEFKDEYGADIQARIQDRFKNQADAKSELEGWRPVIEALKRKAEVTDDKEFQQLILNDQMEAEAEEQGITAEAYKHMKEIEAENARFKAAEESAQNRQHIQNLFGQCEELKKVYPNIDFFAEMNDEDFRTWTSPAVGMSFEQAYMAKHGKELQTQAVAYGMERTREQMSQTIQAQRARPGEGAMNGRSQAAAAEPRMNPANMTRAERRKFKDYIKAHGPIDFDRGG